MMSWMRRGRGLAAISLVGFLGFGCEAIEDAFGDGGILEGLEDCPTVCSRIESCDGVSPPPLDTGSWSGGESVPDNDILACAGNCAQVERRVQFGYSDCQIECLKEEGCGTMAECWQPRSATYQRYCPVEVREIEPTPPPPPADMPDAPVEPDPIDNGSESGSQEVDELIQDPAINGAIAESDSQVFYGDNPPSLQGLYGVVGSIDRSQNARPAGSPINSQICFQGTESLAGGSVVSYCERGRPGLGRAPIIGDGQSFTAFFELEGAPVTIMFSGTLDGESNVPRAEALVTYTYGENIWEHSFTEWTLAEGECSCPI